MKRFLLISCLLLSYLSEASHIVGGEFELIYISGNTYRLNMILYFDVHNGNPLAEDLNVTVSIFRKLDNARMMDVVLPEISKTHVNYSNISCVIEELETNKLVYSTIISLPAAQFSEPQGYYIAWERCCRNYTIDNIYSQAPPGLLYAGQTFYLEIPPVVKDGAAFINSTPRLFPPLSDYACVGKPYYVDFSGTDDDGDSLVYSLTTPLNTKTPDAVPPPIPPSTVSLPRPRPYPLVLWRTDEGFSEQHMMKGLPDLAISTDGLLTVTPTEAGLFVFAVKCEEYRDGVKIGETRRDFQMLSVVCPTAVPPVIKGKKLSDPSFSYVDNMSVIFPPNTTNANRCIEVQITDADVNNDFDNFTENIKIRARAIGNKANINEVIMPAIKSATLTQANGAATFMICFDECPLKKDIPYQIQIIASDDACALPLLDTLRLTVTVQTPPNNPASFIVPSTKILESMNEGDAIKTWPIQTIDPEGDSIIVTYLTDGFALPNVGMNMGFTEAVKGTVNGSLSWDPSCDRYDFSVKRNFSIKVFADDKDFCSYNGPDTAYFNLALIPPPNADPIIYTDLVSDQTARTINAGSRKIYDKIDFNVFGHDDDAGYPITLKCFGVGYQLIDYHMTFPEATGNTNIQSHFSWPLDCDWINIDKKDNYTIRFIIEDKNNKCKIYQADTVDVLYKILPPDNQAPIISLQNMHPETISGTNEATSFWGLGIDFNVKGTDADKNPIDGIKLELINATGNVDPTGYSFVSVSGKGEINSLFSWLPDCSIFKDDVFENNYAFKFRVLDDRCSSGAADTITLKLNVKDYLSTDKNFNPVSVITPNEDGKNDFFALDGYSLRVDGSDPNNEINLPLDNCLNRFEYINIYDRWGKPVYTSNNRYFKWYAPKSDAGVYYYFLKFTQKDYKGSVMVRY